MIEADHLSLYHQAIKMLSLEVLGKRRNHFVKAHLLQREIGLASN
jgi:hypothetical protein